MTLNFSKQTLLLALLTLLLIALLSMISVNSTIVMSEGIGLFGDYITYFQTVFPTAARVISFILIILTGFNIGRLTIKYNLYVNNSNFALPIYGLFASGIVVFNNYLLAYIISYMLMLAIKAYFNGYKLTKYGFYHIFKGSLILGLMPYIYPSSIVLIMLLPLSILLFKRSLREFIVAVSGFILPSLLISYISWITINEPLIYILKIKQALFFGRTIDILESFSMSAYITLVCYLLLLLCALYYRRKGRFSSSVKAKSITLFNIYLLIFTVFMYFIRAGTNATIALIAIPVSMFIPIALAHFKNGVTIVIYILLLLLYLIKILTP